MEEKTNQEIEILAWELFQKKSKISFKRTLTIKEKNEIIARIPEYQEYRDEALRIQNKKLERLKKTSLIKKYPVIKVPANGKSNWYGGARTMCFVYSRNHGNFILEGYRKEVEEYLKKHYTHYFCYMSMWYNGQCRGMWYFWKDNIGIFEPYKGKKRNLRDTWKYVVRPYSNFWSDDDIIEADILKKTLTFKRMPKRWIPQFNMY